MITKLGRREFHMKKITKLLSLCLAVALCITAFASCGLVQDTEVVERARITRETVLTLPGDIEVTGGYYGYYGDRRHCLRIDGGSALRV